MTKTSSSSVYVCVCVCVCVCVGGGGMWSYASLYINIKSWYAICSSTLKLQPKNSLVGNFQDQKRVNIQIQILLHIYDYGRGGGGGSLPLEVVPDARDSP